jgi:inward rectifier potassium channel
MAGSSQGVSKNDLGLDNQSVGNRKRTINRDGSFNIIRKNNFWTEFHVFRWIITCKWSTYWLIVLSVYASANFLFASLYYMIGSENIIGIESDSVHEFWQCYFFSLQTFTTVGYGVLAPSGMLTSALAGVEAFLGLMTFAVATGSLYGRFSKPKSKIKYSPNALIAPFRDGKALMFMLCNNKKGDLVELTAKLNFSWVEDDEHGKPVRKFALLPLDIEKINMLALSWTIVHPIDANSIINKFKEGDFVKKDVEIFILISAYDDTFAQIVHSRNSYLGKEVVWNAKFKRPFYTDDEGNSVLDVLNLGEYENV